MVRYQGVYLIGEVIVEAVKKQKCKIKYQSGKVKISNSLNLDDYLRALLAIYRPEVILYLKRPQRRSWNSFTTWLRNIPSGLRYSQKLGSPASRLGWIRDYMDQQDASWSEYQMVFSQASAGWNKAGELDG